MQWGFRGGGYGLWEGSKENFWEVALYLSPLFYRNLVLQRDG